MHEIKEGRIALKYICSADMKADLLTKPLPGPGTKLQRERVGIFPVGDQKEC